MKFVYFIITALLIILNVNVEVERNHAGPCYSLEAAGTIINNSCYDSGR